jgi:hypothetical protein
MNIKSVIIKIGIIVGSVIALLAVTVLVLFILAPKMPEPQKEVKTPEDLDKYLELISENNTPPANEYKQAYSCKYNSWIDWLSTGF